MEQIKCTSFEQAKEIIGNAKLTNHAAESSIGGNSRTVAFYYREGGPNIGKYEYIILDMRTNLCKCSVDITINILDVYDEEDKKLFSAAIDGLPDCIREQLANPKKTY